MDSISQMALDAALGEFVPGRAIGRRAAVLGAALGTPPDLDVLVLFADALDGDVCREGWHSLLDEETTTTFTTYDGNDATRGAADAFPSLARLVRLADGFVRLREREGALVATDPCSDAESNYVLSFVVGERSERGDRRPVVAREQPPEVDVAALGRVLRRVVDEGALQETR